MDADIDYRRRRTNGDGYDRVTTLLPLRRTGPPTDVSDALDLLLGYQRPQPLLVPNLTSVAERARPHPYAPALERSHLTERGAAAAMVVAERDGPTRPRADGKDARWSKARPRPRSRSPVHAPTLAASVRRRGTDGGAQGCATASERVRFRAEVARKLMELYDEATELDACSDNMCAQVTEAMRADPRRAREVGGTVRLVARPTEEQERALAAVSQAMAVLREACVELVAAYLTPEEKRHLGVDTNLFQTRAERETTYQYTPAPAKKAAVRRREAVRPRRAEERTESPATDKFTTASEAKGSVASAVAASTATSATPRAPDPAPAAYRSAPDAASVASASTPLPSSAATPTPMKAPPTPAELHVDPQPPARADSSSNSSTAVHGTPERQRAPGDESVSTLGGAMASTVDGSPVRPAAPAAVQPTGGMAVAQRAGPVQPLATKAPVGVLGGKGAALLLAGKAPPGMLRTGKLPAGAVLVSKVAPPPLRPQKGPPPAEPAAAVAVASLGTPSMPTSAVPPLRAQRVTTVRPEFRHLLIDSDSDSNA